LVIQQRSTPQSIALARQSGAHHVFDTTRDDIAAEVAKLTGGRGVDLASMPPTASQGFRRQPRKTVRQGGSWIVLA